MSVLVFGEPRKVQIKSRDSRRAVKVESGTCLWFPVTEQQAEGSSQNKRNAIYMQKRFLLLWEWLNTRIHSSGEFVKGVCKELELFKKLLGKAVCNFVYLMWPFYQGLDDLQKAFWTLPMLCGTLNNNNNDNNPETIWGNAGRSTE